MITSVFAAETTTNSVYSLIFTLGYVAVFALGIYCLIIRPQKKQQQQQQNLQNSVAVGDSVLTTAGFFGVVVSIEDDDTVIVEFGSNRNCRIPMQRAAIVDIERDGQ